MTSKMEIYKPYVNTRNLCPVSYTLDILTKIFVENLLVALEWQAVLVRAMFDLNCNVRRALTDVEETFPRLKRPEEVIKWPCWERIDVENVANVKTVEQAGQKKSKGKKKSHRAREKKRTERERAAERDEEEKERLRRWEECWEKKLQEEEDRDMAECCVDKGLCLKPRTQSNIWINVTQDRSIQEIHMAFKHVPVPRPKPPPLPPPPQEQKVPDSIQVEKSIERKAGKKTSKTKSRKK